ncbi:MAG: hypothetical protein JSS60_05610 [Verrucomicrobia bacterium]|nr:hypothetical protein [Verrucomicrobiota bacterium]
MATSTNPANSSTATYTATTAASDTLTVIPISAASDGISSTATTMSSAATTHGGSPWYSCFKCFQSAVDAFTGPFAALFKALTRGIFSRESASLMGNETDVSRRKN